MGTIRKQTIAGSIYTYLGVLIGFVTTLFLMPRVLQSEQIGLLKLLVSFSTLFATLGNLGTTNVTLKQFPYFRDQKQGHNGYLFLLIMINLVGFLLMLLVYFILKPWLIASNIEKSPLFIYHINYILFLLFFQQFFNVFDAYFRSLYNAIKGTFAKELLQRFLIFSLLLLYTFTNFISFDSFVFYYCAAVAFPTVYLVISAKINGYLFLKPKLSFLTSEMRKEMSSVGILGVITGISGMLVLNIDTIMISSFLGLDKTGIYTISIFISITIVLPSRMLKKIGGTFIAEAWKKNDTIQISEIHKKSTINQLLVGSFIFSCIWVNTRLIFHILPSEYQEGLYAILFISLANVVEMAGGLSGVIIGTSKKYIYNTYFIFIFMILAVATNYLLIPKFGITGAAIASFISITFLRLCMYIHLYKQYGFQPYSIKHIIIIAMWLISIFSLQYLPAMHNVYLDTVVKTVYISLLFASGSYSFKVSSDLNIMVDKYLGYFKK